MATIFGKPKQWFLYNLETDDKIEGQFIAEDVTENMGAVWSERFALNRQHGILQWIHGQARVVSFKGRFFMTSELGGKTNDPIKKLQMLKSWTERDSKLERPPILAFWVGDSHLRLDQCILEQLSSITYAEPTFSGSLRDVSFTVQLKEWYPYSIEFAQNSAAGETRYHYAAQNDYYEMLTYREYDDPMMGDIIRKRHPTKANVQIGDVIKLPSASVIEGEKVTQTSVPLKTAYGRKDTVQKRLRQEIFDRKNVTKVSHVVLE